MLGTTRGQSTPYKLPLGSLSSLKMTTFFTFVLLPLVLIIAVLSWVSETKNQKIRRWVKAGISQREAARRLGVSRYQVANALALA